jgi:hypothetical protein
MARRRLDVDMGSILEAIDYHGDPHSFLHRETGRVEMWLDPDVVGEDAEFDPDDPDWVEIPQLEGHEGHRLMQAFADSLDEEDVQEQMRIALAGRGAFRRFRDVLSRHADLQARWDAAQREALLRRAVEWLHDLDIEPVYVLPEPRSQAPAATPPKPRFRVTLTDLLLLGAPEGKTEIIDGRMHRMFVAADAGQARRAFADLARELTEQVGIGWRKRFVEGRDDYVVGRNTLRVEGNLVTLEVEVSWETWEQFQRGG